MSAALVEYTFYNSILKINSGFLKWTVIARLLIFPQKKKKGFYSYRNFLTVPEPACLGLPRCDPHIMNEMYPDICLVGLGP